MYNKRLILLFISTIFLITINSCSKDKNNRGPEIKCDYVKEILEDNGPNSTSPVKELTYDKVGRIIRVKGRDQDDNIFRYTKTTIEQDITRMNGPNKKKLTSYLDNKGRITGTSDFNNEYKYNSDGYLVSFKEPIMYTNEVSSFTTYTLTYEKGNLVRISTTDNDSIKGDISFTYFDSPAQNSVGYNSALSLLYLISPWDHQFLIEGGFYGKPSKNLLKSINYKKGDRQWPQEYEFDAKGRIIKFQSFGFKYQCD